MYITGSFTAIGTSAAIPGDKVDVSISGTFSGTVAVQRYMADGWRTIDSYTAATEKVIENAAHGSVRLECTAYTSGTINYELRS